MEKDKPPDSKLIALAVLIDGKVVDGQVYAPTAGRECKQCCAAWGEGENIGLCQKLFDVKKCSHGIWKKIEPPQN